MKKLGKFLVVGAVAATVALGTVGFAACGNGGSSSYTGEYKYESPYAAGSYYGVKVKVTVKDVKEEMKGMDGKTYKVITGGEITKVTCEADTETLFNFTATWNGHDAAVAKLDDYLKSFEGKTVEDIMTLTVAVDAETNSEAYTVAGQPKTDAASKEGYGGMIMTDATQSSGRIILAVQAALAYDGIESVMADVAQTGKAPEKGTWAYHVLEDYCKQGKVSVDEFVEAMKQIAG